MRHPVEITTPIPSVEETARAVGVSPSRARELVQLAREIVLRNRDGRSRRTPVGKRGGSKRVRSKAIER
jgi:hypothetical protein